MSDQKTFYLSGCGEEAIWGYTMGGRKRNKPTVKQEKELEAMGLSVADYSGSDKPHVSRKLPPERAARARECMRIASERRLLIASKKKQLLEEKYGPDWKEKGHKLGEISPAEALAGMIAEAAEDGDVMKKMELEEHERFAKRTATPKKMPEPTWATEFRATQMLQVAELAKRLDAIGEHIKSSRVVAPKVLAAPPPPTPAEPAEAAEEHVPQPPKPQKRTHARAASVPPATPPPAPREEDSVTPAQLRGGRLW